MPGDNDADSKEAIGQRIKRVRLARGIDKQKDVYGPLGITASGFSAYEAGTRRPPAKAMGKIAEHLKCPLEFLMNGDPERLDDELRVAFGMPPISVGRDAGEVRDEIKSLIAYERSTAEMEGRDLSPEEVVERVLNHIIPTKPTN